MNKLYMASLSGTARDKFWTCFILGKRLMRLSSTRRLSWLPESLSFSTDDTRREYTETKVLGYSPEQVYNVVADIDQYSEFLPWCKESVVVRQQPGHCVARLVVGFPPLVESYTSLIVLKPHQLVRSISTDGHLFNHLENVWLLRPGPDGSSCVVNIKCSFEFRSALYASMGSLFFDEVARTLAQSFATRCKDLYGRNHINEKEAPNVNRTSTISEK